MCVPVCVQWWCALCASMVACVCVSVLACVCKCLCACVGMCACVCATSRRGMLLGERWLLYPACFISESSATSFPLCVFIFSV